MTYRQRKSRRHRRGGGKSKFGLALVVAALTATVLALSATGYVLAIAATAPDLTELKPIDKGATSVIFASDGSRLGYVRSDEIRHVPSWNDMPADTRKAGVAIETDA